MSDEKKELTNLDYIIETVEKIAELKKNIKEKQYSHSTILPQKIDREEDKEQKKKLQEQQVDEVLEEEKIKTEIQKLEDTIKEMEKKIEGKNYYDPENETGFGMKKVKHLQDKRWDVQKKLNEIFKKSKSELRLKMEQLEREVVKDSVTMDSDTMNDFLEIKKKWIEEVEYLQEMSSYYTDKIISTYHTMNEKIATDEAVTGMSDERRELRKKLKKERDKKMEARKRALEEMHKKQAVVTEAVAAAAAGEKSMEELKTELFIEGKSREELKKEIESLTVQIPKMKKCCKNPELIKAINLKMKNIYNYAASLPKLLSKKKNKEIGGGKKRRKTKRRKRNRKKSTRRKKRRRKRRTKRKKRRSKRRRKK